MDVFLTHVATAWSQNSLKATRCENGGAKIDHSAAV